jgi:glycosyltransferase involved in cell wall biosynthesis
LIVRPRVLMFAPIFHPAIGGAERQVQLVSETLLRLGLTVEVLTVQYDRAWPTTEQLQSGLGIKRIPFYDLCRRYPHMRGLGPLNSTWIGFRIARAIREVADRFDVLHTRNVSTSWAAFALWSAQRCGLGTVAAGVNTGPWFDLTLLRREPVWGPIARRWVSRHVNRWQAISKAVAAELERSGVPQDRVVVIPNGVALPAAPKALPEKARRFLYLGRVARTAPRDLPGLIEAFSTMGERCPECELAIVGGGDQVTEIEKAVRRSTASARIRLVGFSESERWFDWSDVLVQPSLYEGMSNALLEGMAHGVPCIAYDIPPNREALRDGEAGILVSPGNRHALADAMSSLAITAGLCRSWGDRARKRAAAAYDIDLIARALVTLYENLPQRSPRKPASFECV